MSLERFCRKPVVTVRPEESVLEAARKMGEIHVGAVAVIRSGAPVGILTDRDIVLRVVREARDPRTTPVETVMSRDVVFAQVTDGIDDAFHRIRTTGVRRLPIVDGDGQLSGMVTLDDLVVLLGAEIGELMAAIRTNKGP
jgi:CBS domain-containing protein